MQLVNNNLTSFKKQQGLSLIEILVSMSIGLFLLLGAGTFLVSSMSTNTGNIESTRVNRELKDVMQIITSDLKRSGFGAGNVFGGLYTPTIYCVGMSSDLNKNSNLSNNERVFYQIEGGAAADTNSKIQRATTNDSTQKNCTGLTWEDITDSKTVQITSFRICAPTKDPFTTCNRPAVNTAVSAITIGIKGSYSSTADKGRTINSKLIQTINLPNQPIATY